MHREARPADNIEVQSLRQGGESKIGSRAQSPTDPKLHECSSSGSKLVPCICFQSSLYYLKYSVQTKGYVLKLFVYRQMTRGKCTCSTLIQFLMCFQSVATLMHIFRAHGSNGKAV